MAKSAAVTAWRKLKTYPESARISELYYIDDDFAKLINDLIPGFEYPNWAHQQLYRVLAVMKPDGE